MSDMRARANTHEPPSSSSQSGGPRFDPAAVHQLTALQFSRVARGVAVFPGGVMKKKLLPLLLLVPVVAGAQTRLAFVAIEPCRLLDTRAGPEGTLQPGVIRAVVADGVCKIPWEAQAIQANLTVTNTAGPGFLSVLRPAGRIPANPAPKTSTVNYSAAGQTVANAALVGLGDLSGHKWAGVFWLLASISGTDVVVDVSGYYVPLP